LGIERNDFHIIATMQSPRHGEPMLTETTFLGQDWYVEMVRDHLIDNTVGVIGIHGMTRVGKMTLLNKVNNSLQEGDRLGLEYLIWVVASKEFQLEKLQAKVS